MSRTPGPDGLVAGIPAAPSFPPRALGMVVSTEDGGARTDFEELLRS